MKTIHLIIAAAALALSSCAELAGTALSFDADGNAILSATRPLVIHAK